MVIKWLICRGNIPIYWLHYRLDYWSSDPSRGKRFSLLQNIQTSYQAQPASYLMVTRVHLQGKAAEVRGLPLTSTWCQGYEWVKLHLCSPCMP